MPTDRQQQIFGFLLECPPDFISPKQLAAAIGSSDQYIRDACESGQIVCWPLNSRKEGTKDERKNYRITFAAAVTYMAETLNCPVESLSPDLIRRLTGQVFDAGQSQSQSQPQPKPELRYA